MKLQPHQVGALLRARSLIATPASWTIGKYAATKEGHQCSPHHPMAARFCSIGAIMRATGRNPGHEDVNAVVQFIVGADPVRLLRPMDILAVTNDAHGYDAALRAFDSAIVRTGVVVRIPFQIVSAESAIDLATSGD